jgi:integrase
VTGNATPTASQLPAADKSSAASQSRSPSRHAPAAAASIWIQRRRRSSVAGFGNNDDGGPVGLGDPIFASAAGCAVHPESISQLFDRHLTRTVIPRIRFHELRHTHASLLVAAGTPIKVVSERLGHAHPGFTMATYQHLIPGMSATAANDIANMIASATR